MILNQKVSLRLKHCDIILHDDNIVQVNASDHDYTLEHILEIHSAIKGLFPNKKVKVMLVATKFTSISLEARNYLSTPEANSHTMANAFVIKSLAQRILINFMIKVQKRPVPTRFFTTNKEAEEWLKKIEPNSL